MLFFVFSSRFSIFLSHEIHSSTLALSTVGACSISAWLETKSNETNLPKGNPRQSSTRTGTDKFKRTNRPDQVSNHPSTPWPLRCDRRQASSCLRSGADHVLLRSPNFRQFRHVPRRQVRLSHRKLHRQFLNKRHHKHHHKLHRLRCRKQPLHHLQRERIKLRNRHRFQPVHHRGRPKLRRLFRRELQRPPCLPWRLRPFRDAHQRQLRGQNPQTQHLHNRLR